MKSLRIVVLLVLAVLLPLRGALAATMLCTPGEAFPVPESQHEHGAQHERGAQHAHGAQHSHGVQHAHGALHEQGALQERGTVDDHSAHDQGYESEYDARSGHAGHAMHVEGRDGVWPDAAASHADGQGDPADSSCGLCAAGCQAAPFAAAPIAVLEALLAASIVFPTTSAAAPAFHSEGHERPPRSI